MKTLYLALLLILNVFSCVDLAFARIYEDCVKGYQFGDYTEQSVKVPPIASECQDLCIEECKVFSFLYENVEQNDHIIKSCLINCKNGRLFSSATKTTTDTHSKPGYYTTIQTRQACNPNITLSPPISAGAITAGEKIRFSLHYSDDPEGSVIYMCGLNTIELEPIFSSLNSADWNLSTRTGWTERGDHMCLLPLTKEEWDGLSNAKSWNPGIDVSSTLSNEQKGPSGYCKWSARNPNFTDTGLYIADGDDVSITWYGNYGMNLIGPGNIGAGMDRIAAIKCARNKSILPTPETEWCNALWQTTSILELKPPNSPNLLVSTEEPIQLNGEASRIAPLGVLPSGNFTKHSEYGLEGSVFDINVKTSLRSDFPGCNDIQSASRNPLCVQILDAQKIMYNYRGVLSGFSTSRTKLAVRHPELFQAGTDYANSWSDNYGGLTVKINWGGCPLRNGEGLQYTVLPANGDINTASWITVEQSQLRNREQLTFDADGTLYLRIKPIENSLSSDPGIQQLYNTAGAKAGYYTVNIEHMAAVLGNGYTGFIRSLISQVLNVLLGENGSGGVVKVIFTQITQHNATYINTVRALLVLYFAIFGIMYMFGMMHMHQQEMIKRLLKVSIVFMLISPSSWEFFDTFLVQFILHGSVQLMAIVLGASAGGIIPNIENDPTLVFTIFDVPLSQIFSRPVGVKLCALFLSGLFGVVVFFVVSVSMIIYALAILKAAMMYIYTIIGIALLLVIAPIMIPFILFQQTKSIFDSWWKYLISY